jgi:hypothetical protein
MAVSRFVSWFSPAVARRGITRVVGQLLFKHDREYHPSGYPYIGSKKGVESMHATIGSHLLDRLKRSAWRSNLQYMFLCILCLALTVLCSPLFHTFVMRLYYNAPCLLRKNWTPEGMGYESYCIINYPDAGKVCQSSSECLGGCVIYKPPVYGQVVLTGVCKDTSSPYGCFAYIEDPEDLACRDP